MIQTEKNSTPNLIKKTRKGEDVYFNGHVAHSVKRGDVILRPIIPNSLFDRLINFVMPGNYEHAMVYLGDGRLLNPYPDKSKYIHDEDIFENFSWQNIFQQKPQLLTFARITTEKEIINKAIQRLCNKNNPDLKNSYCSSIIIKAYIYAGMPSNKFEIKKIKYHPFSSLIIRSFDTGYEIAKAAENLIQFKKLQ